MLTAAAASGGLLGWWRIAIIAHSKGADPIGAQCTSALSGAVLALATAIGFGPASADIVTVIATGTTTYDPTGLFGQLGSHITVTYTFDTTLVSIPMMPCTPRSSCMEAPCMVSPRLPLEPR
jgi:hypothetical protein